MSRIHATLPGLVLFLCVAVASRAISKAAGADLLAATVAGSAVGASPSLDEEECCLPVLIASDIPDSAPNISGESVVGEQGQCDYYSIGAGNFCYYPPEYARCNMTISATVTNASKHELYVKGKQLSGYATMVPLTTILPNTQQFVSQFSEQWCSGFEVQTKLYWWEPGDWWAEDFIDITYKCTRCLDRSQ